MNQSTMFQDIESDEYDIRFRRKERTKQERKKEIREIERKKEIREIERKKNERSCLNSACNPVCRD
jgi:hypothetical protein